jgi:hypothetical protein
VTDAQLEELSLDECLALLRNSHVGRVAVVVDDAPIVLPVNFRLVEVGERNWIALRTRPGGVIETASLTEWSGRSTPAATRNQ